MMMENRERSLMEVCVWGGVDIYIHWQQNSNHVPFVLSLIPM